MCASRRLKEAAATSSKYVFGGHTPALFEKGTSAP